MHKLYIISGCNGAGKTTASYTVLPDLLNCHEFVNADEIARGLSPFNPGSVAIEAGRLMLKRLDELLAGKCDFAFETTLATRSYVNFVHEVKKEGYVVSLLYFWLESPELAVNRVRARVAAGGHNIEEDIIRRRYKAGLKNLFSLYMPICDYWLLIDNSCLQQKIVAEMDVAQEIKIYYPEIYSKLQDYE